MLRLLLSTSFLVLSCISIANKASANPTCNGATFDPKKYMCAITVIKNSDGSEKENEELKEVPAAAEFRKKCDSATEEVDKVLSGKDTDFTRACSKVTTRTDAKSCIQAADKCTLCVGTSVDEAEDSSCLDGDSDEDESDDIEGVNGLGALLELAQMENQPKKNQYISKGKSRLMKQRFRFCPIYSKDDFDRVVKGREKHEETKKEAEKEITEKTEQLKKAQRELGELQQEQEKIPREYQELFAKIQSEETQKLQEQLAQKGDELVELILNLQTAEMQFTDAKNAIYKQCFDKAQAALDRLKEDRRAKIRLGQLQAKGGFIGLSKQTSTEEKLEKYAMKVERRCRRKNSEVRKQIRSAEKVFDQTIKRLRLRIQKVEGEQRDIANKLMGAVEDLNEKARLDELKKDFEKRAEDIAKLITEKLELIGNLQTVLSQLQDEYEKQEVYYKYFLEQEQYIEDSGIPGEKSQDRDQFLESIHQYEGALKKAYKTCGCSTVNLNGGHKDKASCGSLENQMNEYFKIDDEENSGVKYFKGGGNS